MKQYCEGTEASTIIHQYLLCTISDSVFYLVENYTKGTPNQVIETLHVLKSSLSIILFDYTLNCLICIEFQAFIMPGVNNIIYKYA